MSLIESSGGHSTYVYTSLQPGEIRLMTLLPGNAREPIQCELNQITLPIGLETASDTPSYEALSYMWESEVSCGTYNPSDAAVHIGSARLFARSNMLQALNRLRYSGESRVLWVDAICINQALISERNEQVSRMRHIYRQASRVLVWVYDEADIDGIIHRRSTIRDIIELPKRKGTGIDDRTAIPGQVIGFCRAPYWRRLWIIQETVSARELIVHCGPSFCEWDQITDCLNQWLSRQDYDHQGDQDLSLTHTPIWALIKSQQEKESLTLWQLLLRHGHSECQDKRDRVYGILGLASDCQNGEIPVDYAISTKQLFERVLAFYRGRLDSAMMRRFEFHLRNIIL